MPLPVAPLLGWLLGLWLAWSARGERPNRPPRLTGIGGDGSQGTDGERSLLFFSLSRPLVISAALAGFVVAPILGYFAAFHGDWSYLYVVPSHRVPSALDLLLVLVASSTIPAGVAVGLGPARMGRSGLLARWAAGPAVLAIAILALFARRLATSASYAQFHGGFGLEPITESALGRGVLLAAVVLVAAVAWTVRSLRG